MDTCIDDFGCLIGESKVATPPKYVKGVGRGQEKPVDPLTIRLPTFLMNQAIEKSNKLKTSAPSKIDSTIKNDFGNLNSNAKFVYVPKPIEDRSSFYDTSFFDWHIAKLRSAEKASGSSSFSTQTSSTDDVPNVITLKDTIKWPSIDSPKSNCDGGFEDPKADKKEVSLGFKSIGQLLCGGDDGTDVDGCRHDEIGGKGEATEGDSTPKDQFKLCVQNIPYTLTEDDLLGALCTYGDVNDCKLFRGTGNHSMAIVTMNSQKACEWAISCLHGEESPFPGYLDEEVPDLAVFQIKERDKT